jgi:hypothetical protein
MPTKREVIDVVWIDNMSDEIILVKKMDAILSLIQTHKERLVCVLCSEVVDTVHIQNGEKQ